MNNTGFIIAIDGPDGSGKTTQLALLKEWLEKKGYKVHSTRASGGTPIGEELRKASLSITDRSAEVDLYISLAMHTALGNDIRKRIKNGEIVLVDRSPLSIIAYQNFGSQLKDQKSGYDACKKMLKLWEIDLLLVFNMNKFELDTRSNRRRQTHKTETTNYYEKREPEYKQRVVNGYKDGTRFAKRLGVRIVALDANGTIEQVHASILQTIKTSILI